MRRLKRKALMMKHGGSDLADGVCISIGMAAENERCLAALKDVLKI